MIYKKPSGMKYTDLCIYIDAHIVDIVNPGENPEIEDKVYNYLWLLVKALAIKKCLFNNFDDYDPFAFYAATRLYFALRKNYWNQGKTIKGKQIRPIKSCLNYTKALLYPMKIEYQNESFREIISEEFVSKKFDAFTMREHMREEALSLQGLTEDFKNLIYDSFKHLTQILDTVLARTPYRKNSSDYRNLKLSIMLNTLNSLNQKNRLSAELPTVILWKLPKSMSSYVRVLLKEFFAELKLQIIECGNYLAVDEALVDRLIAPPAENFDTSEDY